MIGRNRDAKFFRAKILYAYVCVFCIVMIIAGGITTTCVISVILSPEVFNMNIFLGLCVLDTIITLKAIIWLFKRKVPTKIVVDMIPGLGYDYHIVKLDGSYQTNNWTIRKDENGQYFLEVCGAEIPLSDDYLNELSFLLPLNEVKKRPWISITSSQYFQLLKEIRTSTYFIKK